MRTCYFLEDLMLIFNGFKIVFVIVFFYFDKFHSIYVFSLFSSNHIDLAKGPLSQKFQNLEVYI